MAKRRDLAAQTARSRDAPAIFGGIVGDGPFSAPRERKPVRADTNR